jgi:small subunit ribosomal protein S13
MRLFGITIPDNKRLDVALTYLYGIGRSRAQKICKNAGVDGSKKTKDMSAEDENAIREQIENDTLEGDLRRTVSANIKRLRDIKCYRGLRHSMRLPMRGQRTKTNARTNRAHKRATMNTGRRAAK